MRPYLQDADCTLYHGDVLDVAWAAGLFEGEGCISTSGDRRGIILHLSSSDRDVVERFATVVGGAVSERVKGQTWAAHWKTQWTWSASNDAAECVLALLLPFLGTRRSARAKEVLALRAAFVEDATRVRTCPGCGDEFRPRLSPRSRAQKFCTMECYDRARGYRKALA